MIEGYLCNSEMSALNVNMQVKRLGPLQNFNKKEYKKIGWKRWLKSVTIAR